eukprot:11779806-Karenia_brevis.AAC.1
MPVTLAHQDPEVESAPIVGCEQQGRLLVRRSRQRRWLFVTAVAEIMYGIIQQGIHEGQEATPTFWEARAGQNFVHWISASTQTTVEKEAPALAGNACTALSSTILSFAGSVPDVSRSIISTTRGAVNLAAGREQNGRA